MAQRKITLGMRVRSFFTGGNYIPSLDMMGGDGVMEQITIEEYKDKRSQLNANIGWVYTANQAIADDAGAVQMKLYKRKRDGDLEEVFTHEILDLIDNPNNALTSKQFWSLYHSYLNLTGEAYILKLDQKGKPLLDNKKLPSALFPIPSHLAEFKIGKNSWDESVISFNGTDYPITAILRDINPDPENPYYGMSVVRKASLTIDTDLQMKRWNNKLFKNGARPGVVVEVPDRMSDEEYKRFKEEFDASYGGTSNVFKRLILEGGAKIQPFMMNSQDLDFLESKRFTRDEILAMFRVSASSIGITEDVNRANAEAQEYQYAKRLIKPRLEQRIDFLNARFIKPIYGNDYVLGYEEVIPEDRTQRLAEATGGVNKWLTIDEVRELYGYEPLEDGMGTQLYVPVNNVPLGLVADLDDIDSSDDDGTGDADDTPPPSDDANSEDDTPAGERQNPKADEQRTKEITGEAKVKAYTLKALMYEKMIQRLARKMFNEQKSDALKWLESHNRKGFVKGVDLRKKDWASDMIDWQLYKSKFEKDFQKILQIIIDEIGQEAYNQLMNEGAFDPYLPTIQNYVVDASRRVAVGVNDETEKQIRATIAQGLRDNESIMELQARVSNVFGTASSSRAYTIAVTESALAENTADVFAWEQTGVVEGKEWYTAEDERTCEFCNDMHKRSIQLNENFFNKGDRQIVDDHLMKLDYRSIGEPPLHPSCRCVLLPVIRDV